MAEATNPAVLEREMQQLARRYMRAAIKYEEKARTAEGKANARGLEILEEVKHEFRAGHKILPSGTTHKDVAETRRGNDPQWKTHAGDNRWHLEQTRTSASVAQMVMQAIEMGIKL